MGDGQHDRVAVHGRVAIAELAGVLHFDREARQFLQQVLAHQAGMVAGAAGGEDQSLGTAQLAVVEVQAAKVGGGIGVVECPRRRGAF